MKSSEKISKGISLFIEGMGEIISEFARTFSEAFQNILPIVNATSSFMNKTMTKKRFRKLLQSEGIQRNEISKIVANNKDPYTYKRLYEAINFYKR